MKSSSPSTGKGSNPTTAGCPLSMLSIVLALSIFLLLGSCSRGAEHAESPQTIMIGGVFHLTGPGSFWGVGEQNGALLAVEDLNRRGGIDGRPVEMIVEDGQTDFSKTTTALHKLIDVDRVRFIVGPTWFGQVASPIAEEQEVLIVSPSAGVVPQPSRFFFDLWPTEKQEVAALVASMKGHNVTRVAVVYSQNDWSQSMDSEFLEQSSPAGITGVKEFPTSPDEKDFRSIIEGLKGERLNGVYVPFAFYPSQGAFARQSKDLGLGVPVYSSSGTENPLLLSTFPEIEGTIYPYPSKTSSQEAFERRYLGRFKAPPSPSAAYAYDSVMVLAMAIKGRASDPAGAAEWLRSMKEYPGVSNTISFDADGRISAKDYVMKMVQNRKFTFDRPLQAPLVS